MPTMTKTAPAASLFALSTVNTVEAAALAGMDDLADLASEIGVPCGGCGAFTPDADDDLTF